MSRDDDVNVCAMCLEAVHDLVPMSTELLHAYNEAVLRAQGVLAAYAANKAKLQLGADVAGAQAVDKQVDHLGELLLELRALKGDLKCGIVP